MPRPRCADRADRGARAGAGRPRPGRASRRRAGAAASPRPSSALPASGISGLPSALMRVLSSRRRWRTAAMPCRASSAIGRCSSGVKASTSVRCCLPGRRRFGFGRCGTSGGGVKCGRCRRRSSPPSGRGPRRSPRSPPSGPRRSPRSPSSRGGRSRRSRRSPSRRSRRGPRGPSLRPPGARCWTTGSNVASDGNSSRRPTRSDFSFGGTTDTTRMPSMSFSVSTRSWSPTDEPAGRIDPSRTPRGSRAPAARQVQEPSGDELVSSISMRIDIGVPPYRLVPCRLQ